MGSEKLISNQYIFLHLSRPHYLQLRHMFKNSDRPLSFLCFLDVLLFPFSNQIIVSSLFCLKPLTTKAALATTFVAPIDTTGTVEDISSIIHRWNSSYISYLSLLSPNAANHRRQNQTKTWKLSVY